MPVLSECNEYWSNWFFAEEHPDTANGIIKEVKNLKIGDISGDKNGYSYKLTKWIDLDVSFIIDMYYNKVDIKLRKGSKKHYRLNII